LTNDGELILTRKSVRRLSRVAWAARRKGLLVEEKSLGNESMRAHRHASRSSEMSATRQGKVQAGWGITGAWRAQPRERDEGFAADLEWSRTRTAWPWLPAGTCAATCARGRTVMAPSWTSARSARSWCSRVLAAPPRGSAHCQPTQG